MGSDFVLEKNQSRSAPVRGALIWRKLIFAFERKERLNLNPSK